MLEAQLEKYRTFKNSMYFLSNQIVNPAAVKSLLSEACNVFLADATGEKASLFDALVGQMELVASQNSADYLSKMRVVSKLAAINQILDYDALFRVLRDRFGLRIITAFGAPVMHVSGLKVGVTEAGTDVAWHQDWPNTGGSLNSVVVWVPLGGVSEAGGGLMVAEGKSFGLLDYEIDPPVCKIKSAVSDQFRSLNIVPEVGDALIFDQFHPHSSVASEHTRIALSFRFEDAACAGWQARDYEYLHNRTIKSREFAEWQL